jgi:hypothetical protein
VFFGNHRPECFLDCRLRSRRTACCLYPPASTLQPLPFSLYPLVAGIRYRAFGISRMVALAKEHLYVVGTTCAESHTWPGGQVDGIVNLTDRSAAQIAVGQSWAAVTQTDGYLLQLPLTQFGALSGTYTYITLQPDADSVPLGEALWGNVLGFTPANEHGHPLARL